MIQTSFDQLTGRAAIFEKMATELQALLDPATGRVRAELLEWVSCPVCGADAATRLFSKQGFDFVRCGECTAVYTNPRLREDLTLAYYSDSGPSSAADWIGVLTNPHNQAWQTPYFEEAVEILLRFAPRGKLLDVGCSIGLFMEVAVRRGFDCLGLELEPSAHVHASARGLNVRRQTLEEAAFPDGWFNAVTLFGVLEHLSAPQRVLGEIRRVLAPGGAVMAIVPSVQSLAAAVLHEQARAFNGRNHLTYFSDRTLPAIFERAGFRVASLDTVLSGLDSILNHFQFRDPFGDLTLDFLPERLRALLATEAGRQRVEAAIREWGLGLRLRIVAVKDA